METPQDETPPPRRIRLLGREFTLPRSRSARIGIGVGLVFLGLLGFLPVLGFWMIPLGLIVLSYEFAWVRRHRRRVVVWWERRKKKDGDNAVATASGGASASRDEPPSGNGGAAR